MQNSFLLLIRPTPGYWRGHFIRTLWESEMSARGCLGHETRWLCPGSRTAPAAPSLGPHRPWGGSREDSTAAAHFGAMAGPDQPSLLFILLPQDAALRAYSEVQWTPPPPKSDYFRHPVAAICFQWLSPLTWTGLPASAPAPHSLVYTAARANKSHHAPRLRPAHRMPVGSTLLLPVFISYPFPLLHSGHTGPWWLLSHPGQVPDPRPSLALLSTWDSRGTGSQGLASFALSPTTSLCPSAIRSSDRHPASPGLL